MKKTLGWIAIIALVGTGVWAATAWPRINLVETGRTPEYPDLQDRTYAASPKRVGEAVKDALEDRPGWRVSGSGQGPGGVAVAAIHETRVFRFKDDVTVKIRRERGQTVVSVRSQSQVGEWDFGQNARNVRELLQALDAEIR
jgi:uncharacterized protein (DUF1499 family)